MLIEYEDRMIFDMVDFGKDVAEVIEVLQSDFIGEYSTKNGVCEQAASRCSSRAL
jgi:hypothetical protein